MCNTIWVQVKKGRATKGGDHDNSNMLRLEKNLDALAHRLGVHGLSEFYDYSTLEQTHAEGPEKAKAHWFDAADGLASLQAIYTYLRKHPDDLEFRLNPSRIHWPKELLDELEYCLNMLDEAAAAKREFRFAIVP